MTRAPLASCEYVTCGLDDQGRYPGQQAAGPQVQAAWTPGSLTVRAPLLDECLPFDDPIDGSVRLDESLRLFVCVLPPLRPGYGREPLAPALGRSWPASHRVCAWLWLPIR